MVCVEKDGLPGEESIGLKETNSWPGQRGRARRALRWPAQVSWSRGARSRPRDGPWGNTPRVPLNKSMVTFGGERWSES